jgi:hypothetical protein
MRFQGVMLRRSNVKVSAGPGPASCNLTGIGNYEVRVSCFNTAGTPADSTYLVEVVANVAPVTSRVAAYAWANDPSSQSYTPMSTYSYNSSGGAISAGRIGVGSYAISFAGLTLDRGTIQVTGYGSSAGHCALSSWTSSQVFVRCYDGAGAAADGQYTIVITLPNVPSVARTVAYATASNPTATSYQITAGRLAYNAAGGPIVASRAARGVYQITFGDMNLGGGDVQVTAYDDATHCNIQSWSTGLVNVRCFDATGAPADSKYTVSAHQLGAGTEAETIAYAWAYSLSATDYTLTGLFHYNASGQAVSVFRAVFGLYLMRFVGLDFSVGQVNVTTYASNAVCNANGWGGEFIEVKCHGVGANAGVPTDAMFTVSLIR